MVLFTFGILNVIYLIYNLIYFNGNKFKKKKAEIQNYINECNELNLHIENLKSAYVNFKQTDYGQAVFFDTSTYNYRRPNFNIYNNANYIYNCSLQICRNAQMQPFKYLCKYFNIEPTEDSLEKFENVLNSFTAAEQGKILLINKRNKILENIIDDVPFIIALMDSTTFIRKLGFYPIDFSQLYFPRYSFNYVSGGGNSSMRCDIVMDLTTLERFIQYLNNLIKFRKSIKGQRALMTMRLREEIKQRDNYTCQKCGVSIYDEPTLLLEIDHIIPLSKGGETTKENLQTLCWKCNRHKGSKIE